MTGVFVLAMLHDAVLLLFSTLRVAVHEHPDRYQHGTGMHTHQHGPGPSTGQYMTQMQHP
jgi:hypothetical protein